MPDPTRSLSLLLLALVLLVGCATHPDDDDSGAADDDDSGAADDDDSVAANDDDSGAADDDDSGAADDDDATPDPDCPDGGQLDPIDLSDGDAVIGLGFGAMELRLMGELNQFGLASAHPNCPTWEGDHPTSPSGSITWLGGCSTEDGVTSFEGQLAQTWTDTGPQSSSQIYETGAWRSTSTGGEFSLIEFEGSWSTDETQGDDAFRADEAEGLFRALGMWGGYLDGTWLPHGFRGSYDWSGDWTDPGEEIHVFALDGVAVCRGAVTVDATVIQRSGDCPGPVPVDGGVRLETGGHVAEIDFASSTNCSGCWPWTLDGVDQAAPICSTGFN